MENKLGQEPAFPLPEEQTETFLHGYGYTGMSKRFYAAIELRVPDSGEEWLDEMIRKANRRDAACAAMQGILANPNSDMVRMDAKSACFVAYDHADELLKQ